MYSYLDCYVYFCLSHFKQNVAGWCNHVPETPPPFKSWTHAIWKFHESLMDQAHSAVGQCASLSLLNCWNCCQGGWPFGTWKPKVPSPLQCRFFLKKLPMLGIKIAATILGLKLVMLSCLVQFWERRKWPTEWSESTCHAYTTGAKQISSWAIPDQSLTGTHIYQAVIFGN